VHIALSLLTKPHPISTKVTTDLLHLKIANPPRLLSKTICWIPTLLVIGSWSGHELIAGVSLGLLVSLQYFIKTGGEGNSETTT
jgi:hypothetical protein